MRQDLDSIDAPPGTLAAAANVRFPFSRGAAIPRPGTAAIPSDTVNNAAALTDSGEDIGALFAVGDAGALAVGGTVFAFDEIAQKFDVQGSYSTALPVRKRTALGSTTESFGEHQFGVAVSTDGHICYVGGQVVGLKTNYVIETPSGIRQIADDLPNGYNRSRVIACDSDFVIISQTTTTLAAFVLTYAAGAWTLSGPTTIGTLNAATNHWDVCPESAATFYVYFQSAAAVATLARVSFPALTTTTVTHAVTGEPIYSCYSDATNVWLGFNDDPAGVDTVTCRVYTAAATPVFVDDLAIVSGSTVNGPLVLGPPRNGATFGAAFGYYRITSTGPTNADGCAVVDLTLVANVVTLAATQASVWYSPISKPERGGRIWCTTASHVSDEWSLASPLGVKFHRTLLARWTDVARSEPPVIELSCDERQGIPAAELELFIAPASAGGNSFMLIPERVRYNRLAADYQLTLYEYALSDRDPLRSVADLGGQAAVIAGQPTQLWARGAAQAAASNTVQRSSVTIGFAQRPVIIDAAANNASGSLTNGVYSWVALYEWVDLSGNLHRSAPSAPYTRAMGTDTQVELTITGCPSDQRCGGNIDNLRPVVHLFRTRVNEEQLRRETFLTTAEQATSSLVTIVSNAADADLQDFLYTDLGIVEYQLAPSARFVRPAETAVWFGGLWDTRVIRKSRDFFPGEPCQSSDLASWGVYLPDDVTGIAYQDGLVYAFCKNSIYIVSGDGPNEQGQGVFAPPRALTTEFGAVESASILETSVGVLFRSKRGFMLIPRGGGNPQFVGAGVQQDIRSGVYDECLGAAAVSNESRTARFLMRSTADDDVSTRVYVYDLDSQSWSYDSFAPELTACGNWPDGFCVGLADTEDVAAYREDSTEFADGSGAGGVTSYVKLHGIRPFGVAGWGRCQEAFAVMQEAIADATGVPVTMTVTTDHLVSLSRTWTVISDGSGATLYRSIGKEHQQCSEIMVEWSAARAAEATALGPELAAVVLTLTPEKGTRILPQVDR